MKSIKLLLLLIIPIIQSCNEDEDGMNCFTPPADFTINIVDSASDKNIFLDGMFEANDLRITDDLNNNRPMEYTFRSDNKIHISSIGWSTEIVDLKFEVEDTYLFNLYVDAERVSDEDCTYTTYNEIDFRNTTFEFDGQTDVYTIFVTQ